MDGLMYGYLFVGVINMKYSRYGKIRFKHYWYECFIVLVCLMFAIFGFIEKFKLGSFGIGLVIFLMINILIPYREKFLLNQDAVIVYKKRKIKSINLPSKITVIISYADVCNDLDKRDMSYNSTKLLKGEWAVSLLEDVSVEEVTKRLHRKGAWRYTNCWVEELLKQHFIYNFVCNQSMLEEVLTNRNFTLIIPETLLPVIDITKLRGEIYIDKGF